MTARALPRFVVSFALSVVAGCGGSGGGGGTPVTPTPTVTSVTVVGAGSPAVGDTAQFIATAAFSDGTTQTVTGQATWESSNSAVVSVTSGGLASFLAAGDADVKATYKSVSGTSHVTVSAGARPKFTLSGTVRDATNGNVLANVTVTIVDGPDAGRATASDSNGKYAIANVTGGSFTLRFSRSDYDSKTLPVVLSADTTVDAQITATTNVTRFYGTYTATLTVLQQSCDFPFSVGPTGTVKLEGAANGSSMTATIVERGTTRTYNGSITGDGSFSGTGGGIIAGFSPPISKHEYNGSFAGTATGSRLDATEFVNFTIPCPGATMKIGYAGSK
jgi:hypothetical protein